MEHDTGQPLPAMGTFDAIVSSFAIHHCSNKRKRELYGEVLTCSTPAASSVAEAAADYAERVAENRPYEGAEDAASLIAEAHSHYVTYVTLYQIDGGDLLFEWLARETDANRRLAMMEWLAALAADPLPSAHRVPNPEWS